MVSSSSVWPASLSIVSQSISSPLPTGVTFVLLQPTQLPSQSISDSICLWISKSSWKTAWWHWLGTHQGTCIWCSLVLQTSSCKLPFFWCSTDPLQAVPCIQWHCHDDPLHQHINRIYEGLVWGRCTPHVLSCLDQAHRSIYLRLACTVILMHAIHMFPHSCVIIITCDHHCVHCSIMC